MRVMYFSVALYTCIYLICSFFTLMMFLTGKLRIGSPILNKKKIDNPIIIVAFSYCWPFTLWITYKTLKNNPDKEDYK